MRSRFLYIAFFIILIVSMLAGCSGGSAESGNTASGSTASGKSTADESRVTVSMPEGALGFTCENDKVDLGSTCRVDCVSDVDLTECKLTTDGSQKFKVYIHDSYYELIARKEGIEKFTVTAPDGSVGSFIITSVVRREPLDKMSKYCLAYPYTSEDTENQLTIPQINDDKVLFTIQQGGQNKPYAPKTEAALHDGNIADFEMTDSMGNKYRGSMEFDMYTIYLKIELTEEVDTSQGTLECDCRMIPSV